MRTKRIKRDPSNDPVDMDANPPLEKLSKIQLLNIIEEERNRNHEVNVKLDTCKSKIERIEEKLKRAHDRVNQITLNSYNEKERLIDLLRGCKNELESLRSRNEVLEAKVSVIDSFNRAMHGQSYSCGGERADITYYLADVIAAHETEISYRASNEMKRAASEDMCVAASGPITE